MQLPAGQVCAQMCRVRACQKLVPPPFDQLNSFPISIPPQILILSGLLSYMENSKPNIFLSSKFMSSYSRVKSKWINLKQVIFVWSKIIILVVHAKCHFTFHTIYLCARAKRITICMIVDCRRYNKKRYPIKRSNEKRLPVQRCFIRPPFEKDPIKGSFFLCRRNFPSALKVYGDNKKRLRCLSSQLVCSWTRLCPDVTMHLFCNAWSETTAWWGILHISLAIYRCKVQNSL